MEESDYRRVAEILRILSHPTRIMIVAELLKGRRCVRDIEELLEVRQPNISQHLGLLKLSGIVDCYYEGKVKCYFLTKPDLIRKLLKIFEGFKIRRQET